MNTEHVNARFFYPDKPATTAPEFIERHRAAARARRSSAGPSPKPVDPALQPILLCGAFLVVVVLPICALHDAGVLGPVVRAVGGLAFVFIGLPALAIAVLVLWCKLFESAVRGLGKTWRGE